MEVLSHELNEFYDRSHKQVLLENESFKFLRYLSTLLEINSTIRIYVAGGFLRHLLVNETLSDIDLFFLGDQDPIVPKQLKLINSSDNSDTYEVTYENKTYKVQVVKVKTYSTLEEILDSFDFTICQLAIELSDVNNSSTHFFSSKYALYDLARKRLVTHNVTYPVSTIRRLVKYANKGYTFCDGTIKEICTSIRNVENESIFDVYYVD